MSIGSASLSAVLATPQRSHGGEEEEEEKDKSEKTREDMEEQKEEEKRSELEVWEGDIIIPSLSTSDIASTTLVSKTPDVSLLSSGSQVNSKARPEGFLSPQSRRKCYVFFSLFFSFFLSFF